MTVATGAYVCASNEEFLGVDEIVTDQPGLDESLDPNTIPAGTGLDVEAENDGLEPLS